MGGPSEIHIIAIPKEKTDSAWFWIWMRGASVKHTNCSVKIMVDGEIFELTEIQYIDKGQLEQFVAEMKIESLVRIASGKRVIGRICDDEFQLSSDRIQIIQEFILRIREELRWEGKDIETQKTSDESI